MCYSNTKQTPTSQKSSLQAMTRLVSDKERGEAVAKMKGALRG